MQPDDSQPSRHDPHREDPYGDDPYGDDIDAVLITEEQIRQRTQELAESVAARYADIEEDLLLVGVLKGAIMFMTDFARALPSRRRWSSWPSAATARPPRRRVWCASLKRSRPRHRGRDVLIVGDIIDSGLTLSWLMRNLSRATLARSRYAHCCANPKQSSRRSRSPTSGSTSQRVRRGLRPRLRRTLPGHALHRSPQAQRLRALIHPRSSSDRRERFSFPAR